MNEWEWLDRAPHVRMLKEPTRRVRFLTHAEAKRLLAELPKHLADLAAFALATGLRRGNVTGLQWSQVDLVRRLAWIHPDQAEARKAIAVPLNAEAVLVIRAQIGRHPTHVFSFKGKPVRQVSTKAWYAALERAGIHDFRWHDLAAYLGKLARAAGHAVTRVAGTGRVGESGDGAALRAPHGRASGPVRGSPKCLARRGECCRWHVFTTAPQMNRACDIASP